MTNRPVLVPVLHICGLLLTVLGVAMLLPALVDLANGSAQWSSFVGACAITLALSGSLVLATGGRIDRFTVKQTFLLTTLSWCVLAVFGAIPFMLAPPYLSATDAFFEAMSGLTTTGATVITTLDEAPAGILLWRALLHWYGGVGIIVMAIAVLPVLRVGGMQLFRTESSERGDKPFAHMRDTAGAIALIYLALTVVSATGFGLAGMTPLNAVCHAMSAIATGGFSTHDASLGHYDTPAVMWVAVASMMAAAIPLTYYIRLTRGFPNRGLADTQVLSLLGVLLAGWTVMTLWTTQVTGLPFQTALTVSATNVTSIVTGTGFASTAYDQWGSFAFVAFFFFFFIGGCTGSTTGSIKIFRWQILFRAIAIQMMRMQQPHRVVLPLYNGKAVDRDVIESVINFFVAFIVCLIAFCLALAAIGLDVLTAVSAAAAALTNVGPGLGPVVGPSGTYASLPDAAKWLMSIAMLLGRLEVFTVLVLFTPNFWRD